MAGSQSNPQLTDQQRRWLEIRHKGRARYVWYFGVVRYGALWTLLMGVAALFVARGMVAPVVGPHMPRLVGWWVFIAPFGLGGGWAYGAWMWRVFERNTRHLENDSGSSAPA